jgi:hypothetical protein
MRLGRTDPFDRPPGEGREVQWPLDKTKIITTLSTVCAWQTGGWSSIGSRAIQRLPEDFGVFPINVRKSRQVADSDRGKRAPQSSGWILRKDSSANWTSPWKQQEIAKKKKKKKEE